MSELAIAQFIKSLLTIAVMVYFGLGLLLYFNQRNMIYYTTPEVVDDSFQSMFIKSDNEIIKLWVLNPGQKEAVIIFGGNAASAYHAIPLYENIVKHKTVYLVNYRGYGGSSGRPSEHALSTDALNIYDHLSPQHTDISIIGRSIGAGVAMHLAANRKTHKLVLITPFDSIEAVARNHYPFYPMSLLLKDKFKAIDLVDSISAGVLIVVAENDRIIPKEHALKLADAFDARQISVVRLAEVGHNTISGHPDYADTIGEFLR